MASIRTEPSGLLGLKSSVSTVAAVGHLLVGLQEHLLAHELGGEQPVGQVGELVLGVEERARRQGACAHVVEQRRSTPVAGTGR